MDDALRGTHGVALNAITCSLLQSIHITKNGAWPLPTSRNDDLSRIHMLHMTCEQTKSPTRKLVGWQLVTIHTEASSCPIPENPKGSAWKG